MKHNPKFPTHYRPTQKTNLSQYRFSKKNLPQMNSWIEIEIETDEETGFNWQTDEETEIETETEYDFTAMTDGDGDWFGESMVER